MDDVLDVVRVDFTAARGDRLPAAWNLLALGVRVKLREETGLVAAAIQAKLARDLYAFHQGHDVLSRYGFDDEDAGLLAEPDIALGFATMLDACVRGEMLIVEWNLVDAEDAPVPITASTVAALFNAGPLPGTGGMMLAAWRRLIDEPRSRRIAEGNVSAPSPNGATAGEPSTAEGAEPKAPPARTAASPKARAARSGNTRRKPLKA